jgi:hypothetical protein
MSEIKCKFCGLKLTDDVHSFTDGDGAYVIPVIFVPTIQDVKKFYKKETGESYFQATGEKAEKHFYKTICKLTHLDEDEVYSEEGKRHSFGDVECWTDQ